MAQSAGKMGLMALAALVPFAVLLGIATSGGSGVGRSGATFKAVDGVAGTGRRLTTSSSASDTASGQIDFATQLEMTLCLSPGHNTDSASSTDEQVRDWSKADGTAICVVFLSFKYHAHLWISTTRFFLLKNLESAFHDFICCMIRSTAVYTSGSYLVLRTHSGVHIYISHRTYIQHHRSYISLHTKNYLVLYNTPSLLSFVAVPVYTISTPYHPFDLWFLFQKQFIRISPTLYYCCMTFLTSRSAM